VLCFCFLALPFFVDLLTFELKFWPSVLFLASLAWVLRNMRRRFSVSISTASGEKRAWTSHDKLEIADIANALNQAIIDRG
jgi:hypothetical protein